MAASGVRNKLGTLTILNTATSSETLDADALRDYDGINIIAPATLVQVITLEVLEDESAVTPRFVAQQSAGADIVMVADKATPISIFPGVALRLTAGAAVAADRVFTVQGIRRR